MEDLKNVRIIGSTNKEGRGENQFAQPRGVCINHETKELFIVDCNNHRIQVYHLLSLAYIRQIGKGVQGNAPGFLTYPVGICMDDTHHLYVADTNNHRIVVFNHITGCFLRVIGSQGSALGCLNCPYGVCLDLPAKHLYVADYENNRIQVFHKDTGEFIKVIGSGFGVSSGKFNQPIDVAIDPGYNHLYVADYANNRVQVLDKDTGNHIHTIAPASAENSFNGPRSLCVNRETGLLFVSDRENHRIQMYNMSDWQLVRHIGLGMGVGAGQFNRPMELCVDNEEGVLIAVDGYNHRVQIMELPELRSVRERLRASKLNETDRIKLSVKDIKPSHVAMISRITSVDSILHLHTEVPYYLAHFDKLGPVFDAPVQIANEDILKPLISGSNFMVTEEEPPVNDSLRRQGQTFLAIIEQLAAEPRDVTLLTLVSPSLLALQFLLLKGWRPSGLSEEAVKFLLFVVHSLKNSPLGVQDAIKVMKAVGLLLMTYVRHDKVCCEIVIQHLVQSFKMGMDYFPVQDANTHEQTKPLANSVLLLSFDLLSAALNNILGRNRVVPTPLEDFCEISKQGGTDDKGEIEVLHLIFGTQFSDSLRHHVDFRQYLKLCSEVARTQADNADQECASAVTPFYLGDLIERALLLNSSYLHKGEVSSVSEALISNARISFLSCCADVFAANRDSFEGRSAGKVGIRKTRGGRNVWTGAAPIMVGDLVDCMDKEKSWFESLVLEAPPNGSIKVHFLGWGSKWDDIISPNEVTSRIAPLNTHTKNWRAELFEGGLIEIKCNDDLVNQKWMWGKITRLNMEESWLEVAYSFSNEPVVVKKAWLFGETICPVGMHTKDKSKAAAAQVVKPTKKIDEILREKALEVDCAEDQAFFDFDDDYDFEKHLDNSLGVVDPSYKLSLASAEESSKSEHLSYMSIALYLLQSLSRCVVMAVTEYVLEVLESNRSDIALNSTLCAAMKVMQIIMFSPWRKLIARFILRPIYVHAGTLAKLASSKVGAAKELRSQNWSSIFALSTLLERIKLVYSEVILLLLDKMVSLSVEEFIRARIGRTVDCCGFNSVAIEMIALFRADSKVFVCGLKPLVTDQRYHVDHAPLRNLFRGILSSVSPRLSRDLVSVVENNLIFDRIKAAVEMCKSDSDVVHLVSSYNEGKVIVSNEVITDPRSMFAVERAFMASANRLCAADALQYAIVSANSVSSYFAASPKSVNAVEAYTLQHILQICSNEEILHHFKLRYMRLLLNRLLEGNSEISLSERSFLHSLSIGRDIADILLELDTARILNKGFMCYLQLRVDKDEITDREILSMLEIEHAITVIYLSSSKWSKIVQLNSLRLPKMPNELSRLRAEYERFHCSQHPESRRTRLIWCYGHGSVQLAIYMKNRELGEVTVNEIEYGILKILQDRSASLSSLATSLNLEEDFVEDVISGMQKLRTEEGTVLIEVSSNGNVALNRRLTGGMMSCASFRRDAPITSYSLHGEEKTKVWRQTVTHAVIMRVVKKFSRIDSVPVSAHSVVFDAVKELHRTYPNTLFQMEEVKRQFCFLVDAGYIAEDNLVEERSAVRKPRSRNYSAARIANRVPLDEYVHNSRSKEHFSDRNDYGLSDVFSQHPNEPTFKKNLLRWIGDFSWTVDVNAASLSCYGSRIPLPIHGASYSPSSPAVGFSQWLEVCSKDLWKSSTLSMAALLRELNMLAHQIVCKQNSVDYRLYPIPQLHPLEDSLIDIFGQFDANMSDFLLLQLFLHIFNSKAYFDLFLANICVSAATSRGEKNILASCCGSGGLRTTELLQIWRKQFALNVSIAHILRQFEDGERSNMGSTSTFRSSSGHLEVAEGKDSYSESEDFKGCSDAGTTDSGNQAEHSFSLYDLVLSVFEEAWDEAHSLKSVSYLGRPNSQVDLFSSLLRAGKPLFGESSFDNPKASQQSLLSNSNRFEHKDLSSDRKSAKSEEHHSYPAPAPNFTLSNNDEFQHNYYGVAQSSPLQLRSVSKFESPWRAESKTVGDDNSVLSRQRIQFTMPASISNELEHMSRRMDDYRSSSKTGDFSLPFPLSEPSQLFWEGSAPPTVHLNTLLPNFSSFLEANGKNEGNPISGTTSMFVDTTLPNDSRFSCKPNRNTNNSLQSLSVIVIGVVRKILTLLAHRPDRSDAIPDDLLSGPVEEIVKELCDHTLSRMSEFVLRSSGSRLVWWFAEAPLTLDGLLDFIGSLCDKSVRASAVSPSLEQCQLPSLDEVCDKGSDQAFKSSLQQFSNVLECHWSDVSLALNAVDFDEDLFFEHAFMPNSRKAVGSSRAFRALSISDTEFLMCEMCRNNASAESLISHCCGHYACQSCWKHHLYALLSVSSFSASACKCWKNGCGQSVDTRLVNFVLDPDISAAMFKQMYREHEIQYCAVKEKATARCLSSSPLSVYKDSYAHCSLCSINTGGYQTGKEPHKVIHERFATQQAIVQKLLMKASSSEEFLAVVDAQRFWFLYFECLSLWDHVQAQSNKHETDVLIRIRSTLDTVLSDVSGAQFPTSKHVSNLRGTKYRLLSMYLDQCMLCAPGGYSAKSVPEMEGTYRIHNPLPFSSHLLELKSSPSSFCMASGKKRTPDELCALLESPDELSAADQKCALKELLGYLDAGASEFILDSSHLWTLLCQFSQRADITEIDTLNALFGLKLKILTSLRHGNSHENLCTLSVKFMWRYLVLCRADSDTLVLLLRVILELTGIAPRCVDVLSGLDELLFLIFDQVEDDLKVRMMLIRALLVFVIGPTSADHSLKAFQSNETCLERLSHALQELFTEFDREEVAEDRELHLFMYEVVEKLTTPTVLSALSEKWKQSLFPKSCLCQMIRQLKVLAVDRSSSCAADLHKVCVFMMRISKAYAKHASSLGLSTALVDILRSVDPANSSNLLAVCSAIGKLIITFCMREPALKELLKDSELVNALKEKKHQVVVIVATGTRNAADLVNRCNMSIFTLTTAVQSIVLGQPQDAQNLDILTSLGY